METLVATTEVCAACGGLLTLDIPAPLPALPEPGQRAYPAVAVFCSKPRCNAVTIAGQGRRIMGVRRLDPLAGRSPRKGPGATWTNVTVVGGEVCAKCSSFLDFPMIRAYADMSDIRDLVLCPAPCGTLTEVGSGRLVAGFRDRRAGGETISGVLRSESKEFKDEHYISIHVHGDMTGGQIDFSKIMASYKPRGS